MPDHSKLLETLVQNVVGAIIQYWVLSAIALMGTWWVALNALRSKLPPETIAAWRGVSLGIAGMVILFGVLVWRGWAGIALFAVTILVVIVHAARGLRDMERARLDAHPRGYFDYKRDFMRANTGMVEALRRLTLEHKRMTKVNQVATNKIENCKGIEPRIEKITRKLARAHRRSASRIRWHTVKLGRYIEDEAEALGRLVDGMVNDSGGHEDNQRGIASIVALGQMAAFAIGSMANLKTSIQGMPGHSQEANAARAELFESVNAGIEVIHELVLACNYAEGRLSGNPTPPPPSPPSAS